MKSVVAILVFGVASLASAQTLTGHVVSETRTRAGGAGTVSTYNPSTGQWSYGTANPAWRVETDIRVGNIMYLLRGIDKNLAVGKDYTVAIEKGRLVVTDDQSKIKKFRIMGETEVKP